MNYEIVTLEEKKVVALSARTNNNNPDVGDVIGRLWTRFFMEGIYEKIQNKANDKSLGIYSDYAGNENDDYTASAGCEVTSIDSLSEDTKAITIPAGKYAKFVMQGNMYQVVAEFWSELWKMNLDRSYTYDFEEYQNADMDNAIIHLYIAIK